MRTSTLFLIYLLLGGSFLYAQLRDLRTHSVYHAGGEQLKLKWQYYYDFWSEREVLHGRHSSWSKTGILLRDCYYREGRLDSVCKRFYPDGSIREITHWRAGQKWGDFVVYNRKGVKLLEGSYLQGSLQGPYVRYDSKGNLRWRKTYQKGILNGPAIVYDGKGKERKRSLYQQGKKTKPDAASKKKRVRFQLPVWLKKWFSPQKEAPRKAPEKTEVDSK